MQAYNTIEEKAAQWHLSSRHVQYLCRGGRIDGAIKRAGSWFIPAEAPSPAKNTKSGGTDFHYSGTKKKIFQCAIQLFMLRGFESVSIRDIADCAGIQQSTIYNHFKSKQALLNDIYDYYCHYYLKDRPSLSDMEAKLKTESLTDIINAMLYLFGEDYQQNMVDISKLVFHRMGIDRRAQEITRTLMMEEGIRFVQTVFDMGVKRGRFAPFDTHVMAVYINSIRLFTFYSWLTNPTPEAYEAHHRDEQALYGYIPLLIKDLKD